MKAVTHGTTLGPVKASADSVQARLKWSSTRQAARTCSLRQSQDLKSMQRWLGQHAFRNQGSCKNSCRACSIWSSAVSKRGLLWEC